MVKFPVFAFSLIGLASAAIAQELPPVEELASRVDLPGFWEIQEFRIVAQAMVGTPIEPRAQIRFEVDASPVGDLFMPSGVENLGPFITVIASTPDETIRTIFGTMDLNYAAGKWSGPVNVENPVDGLGKPQDAFSVPTLVLGSDRQVKVAEDLRSAAAAELRIALEKDRQRLMEQHADEIEAMKATQLAAISKLRQDNDAKRVLLDEIKAGLEDDIRKIEVQLEKRLAEGEAGLKDRLATAETEFQAELDVLRGAHDVKVRELKTTQAAELGATVAAHLEELQALETEHAKAVGALIAEQEREMAEVTSKLETRSNSLESQLAAADEVLALQASLTARQTAIKVNDESIRAAEQERQVQFGQSLEGLLGVWTGTVVCQNPYGGEQLYSITLDGQKVAGRSVEGHLNNVTARNGSEIQVHLVGNDLTLPLQLKATLNNGNTIFTQALDLNLDPDGWMLGESPDGRCKEFRASKN